MDADRSIGEAFLLTDDHDLEWQPMAGADMAGVLALADLVHPTLPEDRKVFEDRLRIYPQGCFVLPGAASIDQKARDTGEFAGGYAIAHPWRGNVPPKLNTVLGKLPNDPDRFYIHDVVVAPSVRGGGHAARVVARLLEQAGAFPAAILVSVYGTVPFWSRFGFRPAPDLVPEGALDPYGPGACFMIRSPTQ